MKIIVIGDLHGDYERLQDIMNGTNADIYLQVGDFAGDEDYYPDLEKPLYFIRGNHECFDILDRYQKPAEIQRNLIYIPNGEVVEVDGIRIGALGGNYSPVSFLKKRSELSGKRRAHITAEDYKKALRMENLDILLTHEAPSPFHLRGKDVGLTIITSLLFALKPRFHFFGHHHIDKEMEIFETKSYCVGTLKEVMI